MSVLQNAADQALVPLHGRRLGLIGDGQSVNSSLVQVDNVPVASTRSGVPSLVLTAAALAAAGAITLAGVVGTNTSPTKLGDNVQKVIDLTGAADVTASFEGTVSQTGQLQQTANLTAGHLLLIYIQPNS